MVSGTYRTASGRASPGGVSDFRLPSGPCSLRIDDGAVVGAVRCRVGSPGAIWLPWPTGSGGPWWVGGGEEFHEPREHRCVSALSPFEVRFVGHCLCEESFDQDRHHE